MMIVGHKPIFRNLSEAEKTDDNVETALYIGVSTETSGYVLKNESGSLIRLGVPNHNPVEIPQDGTVANTLRRHIPPEAILHSMVLKPGQHYPRMARPNDQHPVSEPSTANFVEVDQEEVYSSSKHFSYLMREVDEIFSTIAPSVDNFGCYGDRIRNALLLFCTECENQMRGVLRANGVTKDKYNTSDFFKLLKPMRLAEYQVNFAEMPWIGVTSRKLVRNFLEQLWFEFVPVFHGLQGRFAAQD